MKWLIRNSDGVRFNLETGMAYDKHGVQLSGATSFVVICNALAYNLGTLVQEPMFEPKVEYPRIFESKDYVWVFNNETNKKMYRKDKFVLTAANPNFCADTIVNSLGAKELVSGRREEFIKTIKEMF